MWTVAMNLSVKFETHATPLMTPNQIFYHILLPFSTHSEFWMRTWKWNADLGVQIEHPRWANGQTSFVIGHLCHFTV